MNWALRGGLSVFMGLAAKAMFMLGGGSYAAQWFPQISHSFLASIVLDPITAQAMMWLSWPVGLLAWAPLVPWQRAINTVTGWATWAKGLTSLTATNSQPAPAA